MPISALQNDEMLQAGPTKALPFMPIIVAGAPRSGTHFIHALICTSKRANPFAPEYHYFYFLLEAYLRSLKVFNAANCAGFPDSEAFARHHFGMMRSTLVTAWEHLGRTEHLVMKHCSLTPVLPVLARQFETMKFVVILRDPRDAIASEVRAARKGHGDPNLLPMDLIEHAITRFNLYYGTVIRAARDLGDRLHCVRYENLAHGLGMDTLSTFLDFPDIEPAQLWKRATFDIGGFESFKMHSNLWGKPLSAANIGRYKETLPESVTDRIFDETRRVMLRFEALHETFETTTAQDTPQS
jgi:hypothetical protein